MLRLINKEIENCIIKILCFTLLIMFTLFIWKDFEKTSFASVAKYYDNYISLNNSLEYIENYYDNINSKYVIKVLINNIGENFDYKLLLRINSVYDTSNVTIKVNNNESPLEDNRYDYTENSDYYLLDMDNTINRKIYQIELNLNNSELDYSLEIIKK